MISHAIVGRRLLITSQYAEMSVEHEAALSNIDDLPVDREPEDLPVPICSWRILAAWLAACGQAPSRDLGDVWRCS